MSRQTSMNLMTKGSVVMSTEVRRKLTTILAADAEGYSRAMDTDEVGTFGALRAARAVFSKFIERHHGRIVNTAGDGLIAEFPSVVEAVQCAIEVQQELGSRSNNSQSTLRFRIGIHLGDVMIDGSDLLGEGVNLAARLETMAEPGGVLISQQVYDQVQHKLSVGFEYLGEKRPKNFSEDVSVYRLSHGKNQNTKAPVSNKTPPSRHLEVEHAATHVLRQAVIQQAKLFTIGWIALLVIDLTTGASFWAHWPGLVMATLLALKAAPLYIGGWFKLTYARGVIVVGALTVVNAFTWNGYPWVFWPAGVLIVLYLMKGVVKSL